MAIQPPGPVAYPAMDPRRLVLIPSYNTGSKLLDTVREARAAWAPVWVVVDGSTDGSDVMLRDLMGDDPHVRLLTLPGNGGTMAIGAITGFASMERAASIRDAGMNDHVLKPVRLDTVAAVLQKWAR